MESNGRDSHNPSVISDESTHDKIDSNRVFEDNILQDKIGDTTDDSELMKKYNKNILRDITNDNRVNIAYHSDRRVTIGRVIDTVSRHSKKNSSKNVLKNCIDPNVGFNKEQNQLAYILHVIDEIT